MKKLSILMLLICAAATLSACYRAPTAEDYSIHPMTNNREITREPASMVQGIKM